MMRKDAHPTRLLISVRSELEAKIALSAGADLIDVKEPDRGALGPASAETLQAVVRAVAGRRPVSAALGELKDEEHGTGEIPHQLAFAKLGLAGCADCQTWLSDWRQTAVRWPVATSPVAVVYADWQTARAPGPEEVLAAANELACPALLIDTFDKQGGDLLERWPLKSLGAFVERVARDGRQIVLAGSLSEESIRRLLPLRPTYIGVRRAVCDVGRSGRLSFGRVRRLANLLTRRAAQTTDAR